MQFYVVHSLQVEGYVVFYNKLCMQCNQYKIEWHQKLERENGEKHDHCFSTNVNYESDDNDHSTLSGNTCPHVSQQQHGIVAKCIASDNEAKAPNEAIS